MLTLVFRGIRSTQTTAESQHFKTSHSPTTRSISEAPAQDTHHWHHSARQPAIPHVHARFNKHPLARGMHQPLPLRFQILHQVERYPVVDLNIGVNDTLRCDIMALPKQIHPTTLPGHIDPRPPRGGNFFARALHAPVLRASAPAQKREGETLRLQNTHSRQPVRQC